MLPLHLRETNCRMLSDTIATLSAPMLPMTLSEQVSVVAKADSTPTWWGSTRGSGEAKPHQNLKLVPKPIFSVTVGPTAVNSWIAQHQDITKVEPAHLYSLCDDRRCIPVNECASLVIKHIKSLQVLLVSKLNTPRIDCGNEREVFNSLSQFSGRNLS